MTPDLDDDGYPTEETLAAVRNWDFRQLQEWFAFVRAAWCYPDYFRSRVLRDGRTRYYVSTGGWSGNESLIAAMKGNFICWGATWLISRRGGHYIFDVR